MVRCAVDRRHLQAERLRAIYAQLLGSAHWMWTERASAHRRRVAGAEAQHTPVNATGRHIAACICSRLLVARELAHNIRDAPSRAPRRDRARSGVG